MKFKAILMKFSLTSRKRVSWISKAILDSFRDAFSACNLHDLGFSGYEFSLWNKRDGVR